MNKEVKDIIQSNKYLTLSTVNSDSSPHASPLFFVEIQGKFYWWSAKDSVHSANIRRTGQGYLTIFNSTTTEEDANGVYILAKVIELGKPSNEILKAYNSKAESFNLEISNASGDSPSRLYMATPNGIWVNSSTEIDGNYIDTREAVA